MKTKEEILKLFRAGFITIEETVEMLNATDNKTPENVVVKKPTREQVIEKAVNETVDDMDIEKIYKIMSDMNWVYHDGPVTLENVIETAKYVTRIAINEALKNKEQEGMCSTGGFESCVYIDDEKYLSVETKFVPYNGFADINMSELPNE